MWRVVELIKAIGVDKRIREKVELADFGRKRTEIKAINRKRFEKSGAKFGIRKDGFAIKKLVSLKRSLFFTKNLITILK